MIVVIRILAGMVHDAVISYFVGMNDREMCKENYYVMMTKDINRLTLTNVIVIIKRFSLHDINSVAKRQKRDSLCRILFSGKMRNSKQKEYFSVKCLKLILKAVYRTHW